MIFVWRELNKVPSQQLYHEVKDCAMDFVKNTMFGYSGVKAVKKTTGKKLLYKDHSSELIFTRLSQDRMYFEADSLPTQMAI